MSMTQISCLGGPEDYGMANYKVIESRVRLLGGCVLRMASEAVNKRGLRVLTENDINNAWDTILTDDTEFSAAMHSMGLHPDLPEDSTLSSLPSLSDANTKFENQNVRRFFDALERDLRNNSILILLRNGMPENEVLEKVREGMLSFRAAYLALQNT